MSGDMWGEKETQLAAAIGCDACRHRVGVGFEGLSPAEAERMMSFKVAHEFAPAGTWIGGAGGKGPFLFTLYSGWALRCREEEPGRRRAAGLSLPGELVGLESVTGADTQLRIRALTDVTVCRFDPARWHELLATPSFAERALRMETMARAEAEDRLLAAGRSARAAVAHFLFWLFDNLQRRRLVREGSFGLPLTLSLLAEMIGLTPVHLRRILRALDREGVVTLSERRVTVHDADRLRELAGPLSSRPALRPLL